MGWILAWAVGALMLAAWLHGGEEEEPMGAGVFACCLMWPIFVTAALLIKINRWMSK